MKEMQPARGAVQAIASEVLRGAAPNEAPLLAWPLACGSRIAARARALRFADGILTVGVPDAAWRGQLVGLAAQYVAALNKLIGGGVKSIEFVVTTGTNREHAL